MRPSLFIPLAVLADIAAIAAYQITDVAVIEPVISILSELPVVGLMIWMVLKLDERHRASMHQHRQFYTEILHEMMEFARETKGDD